MISILTSIAFDSPYLMRTHRGLFIIAAVAIHCAGQCGAADPFAQALEGFQKARGQAIARENQNFLRWLEGALNQARQQKNTAETARLGALIEQLRSENALLLSQGDKFALTPKNTAQLRAFLTGTSWSVSRKTGESRTFTEDGQFTGKEGSVSYSVVGPHRVNIVWSPNMRFDCEFNDDFTEMKELGGLGSVWKRLP
jgi:hypothetical protein